MLKQFLGFLNKLRAAVVIALLEKLVCHPKVSITLAQSFFSFFGLGACYESFECTEYLGKCGSVRYVILIWIPVWCIDQYV